MGNRPHQFGVVAQYFSLFSGIFNWEMLLQPAVLGDMMIT